MTKLIALLLILAMVIQVIKPLGLPGLRRRMDFWKIALIAFADLGSGSAFARFPDVAWITCNPGYGRLRPSVLQADFSAHDGNAASGDDDIGDDAVRFHDIKRDDAAAAHFDALFDGDADVHVGFRRKRDEIGAKRG